MFSFLLQPPFNLGNHQILSNIFAKKLHTVLAGHIYFIIAQSLLLTMSDNRLDAQQIRKKALARNRKRRQRLAASTKQRLTELHKQRKRMQLIYQNHLAILTFLQHTHNVSSSSCANEYCARHSAQCDSLQLFNIQSSYTLLAIYMCMHMQAR